MKDSAPSLSAITPSPTLLCRLIIHQKFASAAKRLRKHPDEASTWLPNGNGDIKEGKLQLQRRLSWPQVAATSCVCTAAENEQHQSQQKKQRQELPLHLACRYLGYIQQEASDSREDLERLIVYLVSCYPQACSVPYLGRYPLWDAVQWNATIPTIVRLLQAHPEATSNLSASNNATTQKLINKANKYLLQSKQEAMLRFVWSVQPNGNNVDDSDDDDEDIHEDIDAVLQQSTMALSDYYAAKHATKNVGSASSHQRGIATNRVSMTGQVTTHFELPNHNQHAANASSTTPRRSTMNTLQSNTGNSGHQRGNSRRSSVDVLHNSTGSMALNVNAGFHNSTGSMNHSASKLGHGKRSINNSSSSSTDREYHLERLLSSVMGRNQLLTQALQKQQEQEQEQAQIALGDTSDEDDDDINDDGDNDDEQWQRGQPLTKYLEGRVDALQKQNDTLVAENRYFAQKVVRLEQQSPKFPSTAISATESIQSEDASSNPEHADAMQSSDEEESLGNRYFDPNDIVEYADDVDDDEDDDEYQHTTRIETEREKELQVQVQDLLQQLDQAKQDAAAAITAANQIPAVGTDDSQADESPNLNLEARLRILDKRKSNLDDKSNNRRSASGNRDSSKKDDDGFVHPIHINEDGDDDDDASDATPQTRNSSLTGNDYSYNVPSKADTGSSTKGGGDSVSTSSWGLLSLTQKRSTPARKRQRQIKRNSMSVLPTVEQGQNSFNSVSFHDSLRSFADTVRQEMDNLQDICKAAAEFYDADRADNMALFNGHKSAIDFGAANRHGRGEKDDANHSSMPDLTLSRSQHRRFSDGGASAAVVVRNHQSNEARNSPTDNNDPLIATARILAAEEDLIAIVREAEQQLNQALPRDLFIALRDVSLKSATEASPGEPLSEFGSFHTVAESMVNYKLIDEVEKICNRTIPLSAVSALRTAAQNRLETVQKDIVMMENLKARLKEEFFDALIEQAERQMHRPMQNDIVNCLRKAGSQFDSLLYESDDGTVTSYHSSSGMRIDFKEMDYMLKEAQHIYGEPFPQQTLISLRRALFVLQSRLEGTDSGPDPPTSSNFSAAGSRQSGSYSESSDTDLQGENIDSAEHTPNEDSSRSSALKDHDQIRSVQSANFEPETKQQLEETSGSVSVADTKTSSAEASLSLHNIFPGFESSKSGSRTGSVGTSTSSRNQIFKLGKIAESSAGVDNAAVGRAHGNNKPGQLAALLEKTAGARSRSPSPESLGEESQAGPLPPTRQKGGIFVNKHTKDDPPLLHALPPQLDIHSRQIPNVSEVPVVQSMSLHSIPYEPEISPELAAEQNMDDGMSPELAMQLFLLSKSSGLSLAESARLDDGSIDLRNELSPEGSAKPKFSISISVGDSPKKPPSITSAKLGMKEDDGDDARSFDRSRMSKSEASLDIGAVFQNNEKPSELGARLKKLGEKKESFQPTASSSSRRSVKSSSRRGPSKDGRSARSFTRSLRQIGPSKSGNLEKMTTSVRSMPRRGRLRATKSDDLTALSRFTRSTDNLVHLPMSVESDDLDVLYKHAVETVASTREARSIPQFQLPDEQGETALNTIVTDTEATYGIEIPEEMIEALREACVGSAGSSMPFLSLVKALHDDQIIQKAELLYGTQLPADLLAAIRRVSLPPGVSMEKLLGGNEESSQTSNISEAKSFRSAESGLPLNAAPPGFMPPAAKMNGRQISESLSESSALINQEAEIGTLSSLESVKGARALNLAAKGGTPPHLDVSQHSDTSWGKLSLSSTSSSAAKESRKKIEQTARKAAKAERKKKAEVEQFMNSLVDFGPPTDDLKDLYKDAAAKMGAYAGNRSKKSGESKDSSSRNDRKLPSEAALAETSETNEESNSSSFANTSVYSSSKSNNSRSQPPISFQNSDVGMLVDEAQVQSGKSFDPDILRAFQTVSRSVGKPARTSPQKHESGSDDPKPTKKFTEVRLAIIVDKVSAKLGKPLPAEVVSKLHEAARVINDENHQKYDNVGQAKTASVKSSQIQLAPMETAVRESVKPVKNVSELMTVTLASKKLDAAGSGPDPQLVTSGSSPTDNLSQLYQSAYVESPRVQAVPFTTTKSPPLPPFYSSQKTSATFGNDASTRSHNHNETERTSMAEFALNLSPAIGDSPTTTTNGSSSRGDDMEGVTTDALKPEYDEHDDDTYENENDDENSIAGDEEDRRPSLSEVPELDSLSGSPDNSSDLDDEFSDSQNASASAELDAIIAETQEQFGMELPTELVDALRRTSIHTLLSDSETMHMSEISSLMMEALRLEDEEVDVRSTMSDGSELMAVLRSKLSTTTSTKPPAHPSKGSIDFEEHFLVFLATAEHEHGGPIPAAITTALRQATLSDNHLNIANLQSERINRTIKNAAKLSPTELSPQVMKAFRLASRSFKSLSLSEHFKTQSSAADDIMSFGNASGYVSALSESYLSEPGGESAELRLKYILEEAKQLNGNVPEDLVKVLANVDPSGEDTLELSESEFDYSASTFSSFPLSPKVLRGDEHSRASSRKERALEIQFMHELVSQAEMEYGQPFNSDVIMALQGVAEIPGSMDEEESDDAEHLEDLPEDDGNPSGGTENRSKSSTISFSYARESSGRFSEISNDADLNDSKSSDSQWSMDDDKQDSVGDLADGSNESQLPSSVMSSSTTSTPQSVVPNKHLGANILFLLKRRYKERLPRELPYVLTRSTALSYAMNTDDEIDIIVRECEEMSGDKPSADLVVALREASVSNRSSDQSSRSRRSRLDRQSSGSFRSSSRSSAMPSIRETTVAQNKDRTTNTEKDVTHDGDDDADKFGSISFPSGSTRDKLQTNNLDQQQQHQEQRNRQDVGSIASNDDGGDEHSATSSITFQTKRSIESISIDDISKPQSKPSELGNSMSTIQMSNIGSNNTAAATKWRPSPNEKGREEFEMEFPMQEVSSDSLEGDEYFAHDNRSRTSSSSTETSYSTSKMSNVSRASTLPSKSAALGVNSTLPLEGMESDDLNDIFKEAARRMSGPSSSPSS